MFFIFGDIDYCVFIKDFGDIFGFDIIFVLEGYVYYIVYDIVDRVFCESL